MNNCVIIIALITVYLFVRDILDYESKIKRFVFWIFLKFLKARAFKNWSFNYRKNYFQCFDPKFIDARDKQ